ncbi:MAG: hypothetical protein WCR80_03910 [Bacilli bacterium]
MKVNRYYASNQICNKCGYKNEKHNRDMNAAINIMIKGMKTILEEQYKIIEIL